MEHEGEIVEPTGTSLSFAIQQLELDLADRLHRRARRDAAMVDGEFDARSVAGIERDASALDVGREDRLDRGEIAGAEHPGEADLAQHRKIGTPVRDRPLPFV